MNKSKHNGKSGFTLIELLVVIAVAGLLAALAVPAIKEFGRSNQQLSAVRQVLNDVGRARQLALANRTDVYMVFVSPYTPTLVNWGLLSASEKQTSTNVLQKQFTGYALFADREVGDQPGQYTPRYLTEWKSLPAGFIISTNKYLGPSGSVVNGVEIFDNAVPPYNKIFPFPTATSSLRLAMPYIAFDYSGRLFRLDNTGEKYFVDEEILPLAKGTVLIGKDNQGRFIFTPPDVQENPPGNSISQSNHIVINGLTGRARLETREVE